MHSHPFLCSAFRKALPLFLAALAVGSTTVRAGDPEAPTGRIEHHRVLWMKDPAREAVISWTTRSEGKTHQTSLSEQVELVTLNTEISLAGDQRAWLEEKLGDLRDGNRWLLASYHRPAYSSVRSLQDGATRRDNWVPLFERYNVDLVCESHDHALKRTLPIRSHAPDLENGIVYIGDGGLGVPQRVPDPSRWWLQEPGFAKAVHHVHMFEIGSDAIRVRAFGMEGDTLDDFTLSPRAVAVEN